MKGRISYRPTFFLVLDLDRLCSCLFDRSAFVRRLCFVLCRSLRLQRKSSTFYDVSMSACATDPGDRERDRERERERDCERDLERDGELEGERLFLSFSHRSASRNVTASTQHTHTREHTLGS